MYALSHFTRTDVHRRHKSPQAHKSYTYAISRLRAKVVLYVRNKSLYAQKSYILRKVAYRAHKPYNLRMLSLQVILTNQQMFSKKYIYIYNNNKDSNPFLHLPSLTSCAVNRQSPYDPVVTHSRKGLAHLLLSVSKT